MTFLSSKILRVAWWLFLCVLWGLPLSAPCAPAQTDYGKAIQSFQEYLDAKQREVQEKSGGFRDPGLPFLLTHGHPTRYSVVLLHGLSDSPYFMRDIADTLF